MQLIAGSAASPIRNVLVVFRCKSVVGAHGHLLVDRPLGDGGLHHRLVVPGSVGVLNIVFIDEHRRAVDHHAVVGLGGKTLAPLLIQRTLKGFGPVHGIARLNGGLAPQKVKFACEAHAEGDVVGIPVGELVALGEHILRFVVARIHNVLKVWSRLQDCLYVRVGVGIGHAPVFGQYAVVVFIHGDHQEAHGVLGVGVYIAVRGNQALIATGGAVLPDLAVYHMV